MKPEPAALEIDELAQRLLERGLQAEPELLKMRLRMVGYHRLLGDLQPLVNHDDQGRPGSHFREGTTLELVWRRYCFDRRLRLLLLDAIERFEVAVRERLVHHLVRRHGPYGYLKRENLPG